MSTFKCILLLFVVLAIGWGWGRWTSPEKWPTKRQTVDSVFEFGSPPKGNEKDLPKLEYRYKVTPASMESTRAIPAELFRTHTTASGNVVYSTFVEVFSAVTVEFSTEVWVDKAKGIKEALPGSVLVEARVVSESFEAMETPSKIRLNGWKRVVNERLVASIEKTIADRPMHFLRQLESDLISSCEGYEVMVRIVNEGTPPVFPSHQYHPVGWRKPAPKEDKAYVPAFGVISP